MDSTLRIAPDVELGRDVKLHGFVNAYGCKIGDRTKIGTFVEIQKNAEVGADCKISSHSFICEGVDIEDGSFVGHGVMFINDHFQDGGPAGGDPSLWGKPQACAALAMRPSLRSSRVLQPSVSTPLEVVPNQEGSDRGRNLSDDSRANAFPSRTMRAAKLVIGVPSTPSCAQS